MHYYNDNEPYVAQWLRNLISAKLIPNGDVDERSITDVEASDLTGYRQCHFFAGIAGWSLALQMAGWPADAEVWTGSCPCQPLSSAGQRKGHADQRHLWPAFHRLIAECRPSTVFGEQVASKDGREWFSAVRTDLERVGYACGGADLPAASVGASHIRQRLWWVAHAESARGRSDARTILGSQAERIRSEKGKISGWSERKTGRTGDSSTAGGMGDTTSNGWNEEHENQRRGIEGVESKRSDKRPWNDCSFIPCADGKARPVGKRVQWMVDVLSDGVAQGGSEVIHPLSIDEGPGRVGRLRAYGNAIVPSVAAEFIKAYMDIT